MVFLVIPGNPGVISFYHGFIDCLWEHYDGRYPIHGVAHAGHGPTQPHEHKVFTLEDQIEHKARYLEALVVHHPTSRLVIIGHSIGCYIGMKVSHRYPHLPIHRQLHLFPTFRHLWKGYHPFVKVAVQPVVRHVLAGVLHAAPRWLRGLILQAAGQTSDEVKYVTQEQLNMHLVLNILGMAKEEGDHVQDVDDEIMGVLQGRDQHDLVMLYGSSDRYTPAQFHKEVNEQHPHIQTYLCDYPHAFVLTHGAEVAALIPSMLALHEDEHLWPEEPEEPEDHLDDEEEEEDEDEQWA